MKHKNDSRHRNISMMMDLYEMTMANGYYLTGNKDKRVAFDVFYRNNPEGGGFSIFAGLEQVLDYLEHMHFDPEDIEYLRSLNLFDEGFLKYLADFRFRGDVYAFREGSVMYPGEPILTIVGNLIETQMVETEILAQINHQSLIATKARRIVRAAGSRPVSDFGARRAHNNDAAIYGARAAYIGGVVGTATVAAGQYFDIPVGGTMAHSWVMYYDDELAAFREFARLYPDNCILLIDTYDVLKSGLPNAIKIFEEMRASGVKSKNYGIRIDSGDLAYLTKKTRARLDEAGFEDAKIVISNSLDEYTITSILSQGGQVNSFGVGERMITSKTDPVFGAVYKMCAVENDGVMMPRIKVSEVIEKVTNPGLKEVYRIYDENGRATAELIAKKGEEINLSSPDEFIDTDRPWKVRHFQKCTAKKLQTMAMRGGKRIDDKPSVQDIAAFVKEQLSNEIWDEEQRFENPHKHFMDMTPEYYKMKMGMLSKEV
ncbi:MAG: nicotinate phosphoribosyltransferase [Schwartzia sp.]|nr:nicotinate phosphoribosyltransferase [Schwartzia sp. (in: firmicutes)]